MKVFLRSRNPEIRWLAIAVPALFAAHWMFTTLGPRLIALLPDSLRAVIRLI